jgi:hypothetical protein
MPKGIYARAPRPKKQYPAELVQAVAHRYTMHGMSQVEIADDLGTSQKVIWRLMQHHGITRRPRIKRNQRGPLNHMWKGDRATYAALHYRLTNMPDGPSSCQFCGATNGRLEWANLTGAYTDLSDYARLCVSCHRQYDARRRRETGVRTSPRRGGDANA